MSFAAVRSRFTGHRLEPTVRGRAVPFTVRESADQEAGPPTHRRSPAEPFIAEASEAGSPVDETGFDTKEDGRRMGEEDGRGGWGKEIECR